MPRHALADWPTTARRFFFCLYYDYMPFRHTDTRPNIILNWLLEHYDEWLALTFLRVFLGLHVASRFSKDAKWRELPVPIPPRWDTIARYAQKLADIMIHTLTCFCFFAMCGGLAATSKEYAEINHSLQAALPIEEVRNFRSFAHVPLPSGRFLVVECSSWH